MSETVQLTYTVMHEGWWVTTGSVREDKPNLMVSGRLPNGQSIGWEFQIVQHDFNGAGRSAIRVNVFSDAFDAWADVPELFAALREQPPHTLAEVQSILDGLGALDTTERDIPESVRNRMQTRRDAVRAVVHDDALASRVLDALDDFTARHNAQATAR